MHSEFRPFRDVVTFSIGGGWGAEEDGEIPVTVVRGTDFERARYGELEGCPRRYETSRRAAKRFLREDDLILEISGGSPTSGQTTGRSVMVTRTALESSYRAVIPASFCRLVRLNADIVDPRFAYYAAQDMYLSGRAGRYENQSTGIANFQFQRFLDEEFLRVPSRAEQALIVAVLGGLDDRAASNRRLAHLLEETVATVFHARFVDRVHGGDLGGSPKQDLGTLSDLATLERRTVQPAEAPSDLFEHFSIPAYDRNRAPELVEGSTILSGKTVLPGSDCVLLSKLNPATWRVWWPRPTGRGRAVCSSEFLLLVSRPEIPQSFLYALFSHDERLRDHVLSHATGTTGSRQRVKPEEVMACRAPRPARQELDAWDAFARPLYDHAHSLLAENRSLAAARDTLLPKLVSGEIRVPDTTDPEEVIGPVAEEFAA